MTRFELRFRFLGQSDWILKFLLDKFKRLSDMPNCMGNTILRSKIQISNFEFFHIELNKEKSAKMLKFSQKVVDKKTRLLNY